ncbi:MAG: protein kinase domain-containing protein [Candidatus Saliniplasma sp.]
MLEKGTVLQNRYKIEEIIAQAGMGNIYRVEDLKKEGPLEKRICALKEPRKLGDDQDHIRREKIKLEIEILKRIDHSNIVSHIDDFQHEGQPYLVQEYLEGETLYNIAKRGPLPIGMIKRISIQILDAIEYLHSPEQNIIHRDIKPHNFILSSDEDFVTMFDFGTAKAESLSLSLSNPVQVATPGYSAPEQIKQEEKKIGPRADIYGVGATLFHLATGENPRKHYRDGSMVDGQLCRPDRINPSVPAGLSNIIAKATSPDKTKRYGSVKEMKKDIRSLSFKQMEDKKNEILIINGKKYQLSNYSLEENDPLTVGRDGDITINDPRGYVSRIHCSIYKDDRGWTWVEDGLIKKGRRLRSKNGTYIYLKSQRKFKEVDRWVLYDGDIIALGYRKKKGPWFEMIYKVD